MAPVVFLATGLTLLWLLLTGRLTRVYDALRGAGTPSSPVQTPQVPPNQVPQSQGGLFPNVS